MDQAKVKRCFLNHPAGLPGHYQLIAPDDMPWRGYCLNHSHADASNGVNHHG
jgi:hypothetical protein